MTSDPFNALGGYTVGIPAVAVIDSNGNVVTNVLTSGNVAANAVYSDYYRYANGSPLSVSAVGPNQAVQFNTDGAFSGTANFTFNSATNLLTVQNLSTTGIANLGDVSSVVILGGVNGYVLQTDGLGNLAWVQGGGGGGNGSPGGSNTQVQFNDAGSFGASTSFEFNKVTGTLTVGTLSVTGSIDAASIDVSEANVYGNINAIDIYASGNVTGAYILGNGYYLTDISTNLANYVVQNNQPNINSVGELDNLVVLGNIDTSLTVSATTLNAADSVVANNIQILSGGNISGNLNINTPGNLKIHSKVDFAGSPNIHLGTISNVHLDGGVNGYVLSTDGLGNLAWVVGGGGGGNGVPGGSNTQVQFNNNGTFGASPYFTYNDFNRVVQVGGNLIANSMQIGAGVYKWSTSEVYFATTASSGAGQLLYSIPVAALSGVEFDIIATEPAGPSRQSCKISSLYYNGAVQFSEYASLFVNGGVGNFEVEYDAGSIITPASLQLKVTPNSSNPITYKMLITVFAE